MPNPHVDFPALLRFVAAKHRVTEEAIFSRSKKRIISDARNEVYYLSAENGLSHYKIGKLINRSVTTVNAGICTYKRRVKL